MKQSIKTKYLGPTNYRGSRIKATTASGISRTYSWDYSVSTEENHKRAAANIRRELGWKGQWKGGGMNDGYVYVQCRSRNTRRTTRRRASNMKLLKRFFG